MGNMKLSIITINFNNSEGLYRTMKSVFSQTRKDFEYCVVDGKSVDNSVEIIKSFGNDVLTSFHWISERDSGIYNAMNKGIRMSNGEYLLFLNSGDWLYDENVVSEFLDKDWKQDIIDGNVFVLYDNRGMVDLSPNDSEADFDFFFHYSLWHQSAFIRKDAFERFGYYDESFRIVSDWDFFMRSICFMNASYRHWDRTVAFYPFDGISSVKENEAMKKNERERALLKYLPVSVVNSYEKKDREIVSLVAEKERNAKIPIFHRIIIWIRSKLRLLK